LIYEFVSFEVTISSEEVLLKKLVVLIFILNFTKVHDVLGNELATLVNEEKQPGVYEVEFNTSSLASGMYLYKLQAGSFIQTKKMILAK
jgi:hypothetical protein